MVTAEKYEWSTAGRWSPQVLARKLAGRRLTFQGELGLSSAELWSPNLLAAVLHRLIFFLSTPKVLFRQLAYVKWFAKRYCIFIYKRDTCSGTHTLKMTVANFLLTFFGGVKINTRRNSKLLSTPGSAQGRPALQMWTGAHGGCGPPCFSSEPTRCVPAAVPATADRLCVTQIRKPQP